MTDGQITTDEANEINSAIDDAKNKVVSLRSALNGIVNNIMSFRISSGDPGNIKCGKVVIKALSPLMFFNPDTGQQLPNSYLDNLILSLDASRPTASAIAVFISAAPASKGLGVLVDGVQHTSYSATWSKGASHNLAVTTPLSGNDGKTYSFQRWSDGNTSTSRSVTPIIDTTYTAIFTNDNASVVPLTASADATVSALNPALNYGTPPFLLVFKDGAASGRRDSLVRFGLGSIPVGSTITRVDFVLTVGSGLNPLNFFEVRKATSSWSENSVNWNNRPSIDPLALVLARADAAQITLSSTVWSGLSNVVQQWVNNPSQNHGFYLLLNAAATPDDGIGFASREDSTESKRPKLTISFRPPDDGDGDTIVNLRAKRSSSGSSIAANTWQLDNDPYFYWDAPSSVLPIVGYSFALDVQPDQTVDTTVAYHQYPSDSLSDGTHTFYVRSVDANDNWGPPASFQIKVDSVAPANGTISINNGAADTLSLIVSMNNLSASDTHSGVNQMRFSNDGGTWSDWESFAASKSNWDLSAYGGNSAPGTKTVFVQYRDSAGNVSATSADSIELLGPPATRIIGLSGDLAFGEVAVGASAQRTLTITNSGNATLNISNISYPVGFSGAWSGPIATNGSQNVTVTFTPTAVQNYGGTVVVSSDATSGINSNSASGTGLALPSAPLPIAAWGDNSFGQTNVPPGLTNVLSIAGGNWHSLAIKPGGTVVEWGFGAGGNASVSGSLLGVIAIDGGVSHSVALQANGDVFAWGANTFGQTNVPQNLTNAVAISAGDNFSVVLKRDGTVLAWGGASLDETNIPAGLRNVVAIAAGGGHGLALKQDGRVTAWGFNAFGQANVPPSLDNVVDVAAGGGHSLALKHDGTVVAWGANIDWSGNYGGQVDVPLDLTNVVAIAAGAYHSLALKCDGAVISWGNNFYGQTQAPSSLTNAVALAGGGYHSLAL
ncbi:MAG: DNRLRE domain-containing protein [Verrucomicrobia bacterium]|nr:DNRLRE domain-containing protein [Verrucomicrobiota bacterium]